MAFTEKNFTETQKRMKRKGRKARAVSFCILAGLFSLLFRPHGLFTWGLVGALSYGLSKVFGTMGEGLDLTTHNRDPQQEEPAHWHQVVETEETIASRQQAQRQREAAAQQANANSYKTKPAASEPAPVDLP